MYPLKAVLIGCREDEISYLREELVSQGVTVEQEFDDVPGALDFAASAGVEKRLILVRLVFNRALADIEQLSNAFPGWPILLITETFDDPADVVRVMRAGACQVVPLPLRAEELEEALIGIVRQFGFPHDSATLIAISGVTEGCGSTTIAINLAAEIAHLHRVPCILIEMTSNLGRVADLLHLKPAQDLSLDEGALSIDRLRQALVPIEQNISVLAHSKAFSRKGIDPRQIERLVENAGRLARFVVLDMPYTYDDLYFETMALADHVLLVAVQNQPSVYALQMMWSTLPAQGVRGVRHALLNRFDPAMKEFTTEHMQEMQIPRVATVANDWPAFSAALQHGTLLRRVAPQSQALKDLDVLATSIYEAVRPSQRLALQGS